MGLTAAQLIPRIRARVSGETDDVYMSDDLLLQDLNDALSDFAAEKDWPWLEKLSTITTSDGVSAYDQPSDCTRIHELTIGGYDPLDAEQYRVIRRWQGDPAVPRKGQPTRYCIVGTQIIVAPVPDDAYTIDVYYQIPETVLGLSSGSILTPDYAADVIVTFAAYRTAIRLRDGSAVNMLGSLKTEQTQRAWSRCETDSRGIRIQTRDDSRYA